MSTDKNTLNIPACAGCRKIKMRCVRKSSDVATPCERCKHSQRQCFIPTPKPLGRRSGALNKFHGVEKALRQIESEVQRAIKTTGHTDIIKVLKLLTEDSDESVNSLIAKVITQRAINDPKSKLKSSGLSNLPTLPKTVTCSNDSNWTDSDEFSIPSSSSPPPDPITTPLDLLAEVSENIPIVSSESCQDKSSCLFSDSIDSDSQSRNTEAISNDVSAQSILENPSVFHLGLSIKKENIAFGLQTLFNEDNIPMQEPEYFKTRPGAANRDVGPEWDPVDLGLLSMSEAEQLFRIYYDRLNPFTGMLDKKIQFASRVRKRSACLFTWIAASGARFSQNHHDMWKRLYRHGQQLNKNVLNLGYKSTEIVQALCLSLYWAIPSSSTSNDYTWLFSSHAMAIAVEMGLDRRCSGFLNLLNDDKGKTCHQDLGTRYPYGLLDDLEDIDRCDRESIIRFARSRERTWFRLQLLERGMAVMLGNSTFQDNELSSSIDSWWKHPFAIPEDQQTCAMVHLRRRLAFLNSKISGIDCNQKVKNAHDIVDGTLRPWLKYWLPEKSIDRLKNKHAFMSNTALKYVYRHNRLWMLSLVMHGNPDDSSIHQYCLQAAVECCEAAVNDLTSSNVFHALADSTWSMLCYSAVFAMKVFSAVVPHANRGSQAQLLGLLANLAMALEAVGNDGFASLYGRRLHAILKAQALALKRNILYGDQKFPLGQPGKNCYPDEVSVNFASDAQREVVGMRYRSGRNDKEINNPTQVYSISSEFSTSKENESIELKDSSIPLLSSLSNSNHNISVPILDLNERSVFESTSLLPDISNSTSSPCSPEIYYPNVAGCDMAPNSLTDPFNGVHWLNTSTEQRWDFEMVDMFNSMWYDPLSSIDGGRATISSIP